MKTMTRLPLGMLQTNCYILSNGNRCLIVDPGDEPERVLAFLEQNGLTAEAILLTHGHYDHVGAVRALVAELDCDVYICEADLSLPSHMTAGPLYHSHTYSDGDRLTLAGMEFTVIHTPGHTPGSVCLLFGMDLIAGDTLFEGSIGRTDFPGSDHGAMLHSLEKLKKLPDEVRVYPGHGPATDMGQEKRYNPYL